MPLQIGIVGLPNVGKSTLFNVLTQAQNAEVANYPFCTIEPNQALVPVPDERLDKLADLVGVNTSIKTTIEFLDIAGLVKGASHGEGLGNQFLGTIRNTDALLHVVRCFEDPNVVHISEHPDPGEDIEIVQVELILSDLEQITKKIEKLSRQMKGDKKLSASLEIAELVREHLQSGKPLSIFSKKTNTIFNELDQELRFLSAKPVIYAANIAEENLNTEHTALKKIREIASKEGAEVVQISALLESELNLLDVTEKSTYMEISCIQISGLEQVILTGYRTLNLISFFTYNDQETRAWTVPAGAKAPEAAGQIHTDFQKGFIKAEVIPFPIFVEYGSTAAVKEAGKLQIEGKEYIVQDGDVILFRFNV
ncbi:MAG: redox-regulated ATPase YchF [Anaerolineales bacterium]|nr:redox-regulated ATPase YchF [Anaerolineales bacterium]